MKKIFSKFAKLKDYKIKAFKTRIKNMKLEFGELEFIQY